MFEPRPLVGKVRAVRVRVRLILVRRQIESPAISLAAQRRYITSVEPIGKSFTCPYCVTF